MNIEQLESYNLADAVKFHNKLNPKIWDSSEHLKPEIREQLLLIAEDFAQSLGVKDLQLVDITISGSNAAYTYTKHSDIDLHLVVDIPELNDEVYRELFNAKKTIYNSEHNIKVKGIDVELYVEPAGEPPHSQGIYSILNSDWIIVPKRKRATIDDMSVRAKYEDLRDRIKKAITSKSEEEMTHLLHKIRELRQSSLDQHGEFGPENLAFKMLRSQGDIDRLRTARTDAKSRELSLKERQPQPPVTYGYGADFVAEVGITPDGTNPTTCQFTNEEQSMSDEEILRDFIDFCYKELKLQALPNIKLRKDPQWPVMNKTFGRYNNDKKMLEVAWGNRHIMDVLRTVAHELTHAHQHERDGERMGPEAGETGSEWENEANARAGILMRDYARLHPDYFAVGQAHGLHESVLDETVEDERFLQQVGNAVEAWAEKFKATNKQKINGFVEPGTIGKITGIEGKTDAQKHLLNLGMIFFLLPMTGGRRPLGAYRPARGEWGGDIGADIRYLIPDATLSKSVAGREFTHTLLTHETDLSTTVAHELRHALDDYLSKGKYDSSAHKYDYHDQTVEINAFFTQSLKSLQQMIDDGTVDQDNLQWAIRRVFYNNELISNLVTNKDPRVKRLMSRAYTYLQAELNKDQQLKESSGYIPTAAEANDPRFEMALSVDVRPGALGKAANALDLHTDSQGHPQLLRADGLFESLMSELKEFKKKTVVESKTFNQCYATACKLFDQAESKGLNPVLVQVAGYKGDGSQADNQWLKLPQEYWQHYVTVVNNTVLDPTARQFGPNKPTKYPVGQLSTEWNKQYQIKPKEELTEYNSLSGKQVLSYIKKVHPKGEFTLDSAVTNHPLWDLTNVPLTSLHIDPEEPSPYGQINWIDYDHVSDITLQDIKAKPIVADANGWILDGNHRAVKARELGLTSIPAYVPNEEAESDEETYDQFMARQGK